MIFGPGAPLLRQGAAQAVGDGAEAAGADRSRRLRGERAYHSGLAAEEIVARDYQRRGFHEAQRRWRGAAGEIDLVLRDGESLVFVEVKAARTHDLAAERLSARQMSRILAAAQIYLDAEAEGGLTLCRLDLALVDAAGRVSIIENASQL